MCVCGKIFWKEIERTSLPHLGALRLARLAADGRAEKQGPWTRASAWLRAPVRASAQRRNVGLKMALNGYRFFVLEPSQVDSPGQTPLSWASPGPLRRMNQRGSNGCHQVGTTH